jgi:hypothetical protein
VRRPSPVPVRRLAVGAAALALLLAACDGGSGSVGPGEDAGDADGGSGFTVPPEEATPFDDLFAFDPAAEADNQRAIQEYVVTCMRGLGWEYTPVDTSKVFADVPDIDPDEFREAWGYGITTFIGREDENPYNVDTGVEMPEDPNAAYVAALSPADQDAYYEDLYGPTDQFDPAAEAEGTDGTDGTDGEVPAFDLATAEGCINEAYREVQGTNPMMDPAMGEEIADVFSAIEEDPRLIEATEAWSACMADAGFDFAQPEEIYEELSSEASRLQGFDPGSFDGGITIGTPGDDGGDISGDTSGDTSGDMGGDMGGKGDGDGSQSPPTSAPAEEIARVQAEEMAIAEADHACQEKHVTKVRVQVSRELQQAFLDANPDVAAALARRGD